MPHLMEYQSGKVRPEPPEPPEPPWSELREFLKGEHAEYLRGLTVLLQPTSPALADMLRGLVRELNDIRDAIFRIAEELEKRGWDKDKLRDELGLVLPEEGR